MPSPTLSRSDIEQVIRRKIERPAYRRAFLQSPRAAIEAQIGARLPSDLSITVLEEGPNLFYVVVPYEIPDGQELSDLELESVSGGKSDSFGTNPQSNGGKN